MMRSSAPKGARPGRALGGINPYEAPPGAAKRIAAIASGYAYPVRVPIQYGAGRHTDGPSYQRTEIFRE